MNRHRRETSRDLLLERLAHLEAAARPLDPDAAARRHLRDPVVGSAERFLDALDQLPAFDESPGARGTDPCWRITEQGVPIETALAVWEQQVVRPGANAASGAHLAYIPGGGIYHAALGDYLAAVTNKYAGLFAPGPGAVRMENALIRWAAGLVGYPEEAAGNLASGGSIATLIAIVAARDAHRITGTKTCSAVAYLSTQAHHCVAKALRIAGLAEVQLRLVPVDDCFRMRPGALEEAIRTDRAAGLVPWLIVATAGTTDTGAVDPLDRIAAVARAHECWFHVDAAYGGFFLLAEHGRGMLRGIEHSDSVVLDPHKGLFLPWGTGMVLLRNVHALAVAHAPTGSYLQDAHVDTEEISPADVSPELTKHFRAVRMWLPLVLLGTAPFRAALDEKLLLARYFYEEIRAAGFEVGPLPDLSIVAFRWAPTGIDVEQANEMNQAILDGVRSDGRVFLSSTMLDGRFMLRMAALSFRTHRETIDLALRVLSEQVALVQAASAVVAG